MNIGKIGFWGILVAAVIVYFIRDFLGGLSYLFFVPIDRILFISESIPPLVMWSILGLLIGIIYGSFVGIKKYKLDFKLLIYPVGLLVIMISLILLVSLITEKIARNGITETDSIPKITDTEKYLFNDNLQKGIKSVDNEEYTIAEYYFQKAAQIDKNNSQLDSLAQIYSQTADERCKLYRRKSKLKYIPNYYYKYAAALTSKSPEVCD